MDTLNHPCADLGLELPSLLEWHHHPECQVDHIVLGKDPPGGSWQVILFVLLTEKHVNLDRLDFLVTHCHLASFSEKLSAAVFKHPYSVSETFGTSCKGEQALCH